MRQCYERMKHAGSYAEWREFAEQLDKLDHALGGDGLRIPESLFDRRLLQQKLSHLQRVRENGNVKEMMFALRTDLIRNVANIAKRWASILLDQPGPIIPCACHLGNGIMPCGWE